MSQYWFKRKKYGYGATPTTWQGWLITLAFVLILIWRSFKAEEQPTQLVVEVILLIILLTIVVHKKTEHGLKWQWG